MRFITATALAISLFGFAPAAEATHGRPLASVAKQRAAEACADMAYGAPRPWSIKTNLQIGLQEIAHIKGSKPSKQTATELSEQYAEYMEELCPGRLESKGGDNNVPRDESSIETFNL